MQQPLNDISNRESAARGSDVFKRLAGSPLRKDGAAMDKPAMRLSPTKHGYQTSPKRLLAPEHLRSLTQSVDRHFFNTARATGRPGSRDAAFSASPTKADGGFSNVTVAGGDGSLSRIRNRFSPVKERKPILAAEDDDGQATRQNLLAKLQREEDVTQVTRRNTRQNSEASRYKVGKSQIVTRSRNVKFELPEDRMIAIELQNLKQLIHTLIERQDQLEDRLMRLED
ncbi:AaceriAGR051Wp [[Ashbya] aceris (nom. inval.)]|nr:AaceriAGR051Wp [[Ashbya] aceris (nom. inval.)]